MMQVTKVWWDGEKLMAEPIDPTTIYQEPAQPDSICNNALRAQGKAYPRTCKKCELGPCVELAQQALDKMAGSERELGIEMEPVKFKCTVVDDDHPKGVPLSQWGQQGRVTAAKKDQVFAASIEFIGTLTGMQPPPIEVAPPEILKPFRDFTEKVCSIFAAPQPSQHECSRSHPHENMDVMCELRTEIARLTNENARLKAQQHDPVGYLYQGISHHTQGKKQFSEKQVINLEGRWWQLVGPVYTSLPAQRAWVGLTDEEIHNIYDEAARREPYNMAVTRRNIARAIEAKLKEKNT